jgi:hypothetical protein
LTGSSSKGRNPSEDKLKEIRETLKKGSHANLRKKFDSGGSGAQSKGDNSKSGSKDETKDKEKYPTNVVAAIIDTRLVDLPGGRSGVYATFNDTVSPCDKHSPRQLRRHTRGQGYRPSRARELRQVLRRR